MASVILSDLDGNADVLRFVVSFLRFRDWQSLSSCNRSLARSDLRRFVMAQAVLRVPPPPLPTRSSANDRRPTASYYANSFLRHTNSELLGCITNVLAPRTGIHLLQLLRVLPSLHSLRFWDYPYWTPEDSTPDHVNDMMEEADPVINVAAVLQLLPTLKELYIADAEIELSDLLVVADIQPREMWHLRTLDLSLTDVVDLAPLAVLPHLQSLNVRRTNVTSLAIVNSLPELRVLDVSETRIVEFSALQTLSLLETLDMSKNYVSSDLNVLQHLTTLRSLKAASLASSDPLTLTLQCKELEILHLQHTRLTNLAFANDLPNLTYLDIRWTYVDNRQPLGALKALEQLLMDTRERGIETGDGLEPVLPAPSIKYEWLSCLAHLKKLRMYKHNYQEDLTDVLQEDVEPRETTLVSTRGHRIPMAHRVPSSFLRHLSKQAELRSLELPPLTEYTPLTLLSPTLHHLRLQQWCAEDLTQISALGEMPVLTRLSMSLPPTAQVMDLLPLENFVQLTQLELLDVLFEDLTPLGALVNLRKLVLDLLDRKKRQLVRRHKHHQTSFECLLELTKLEELSLIGRVDFKDVALLSGMQKMRRLLLNATKVEHVSPLAAMTRLEILNLGLTPVTTVEGIPRLLELRAIWIPEAVNCQVLRDASNFPRLQSIWHPDDYNCLWTDHKF
ncbi:unnamed protein product [Hyaloperonospora brassicae]|uniref:F-box domain-containing protein n=1 Tax=Hyaloperonospora brassicae TaxID=162125 RepID=A0AAV0U898_HYABA|nr:unnamed protein product [Hyaloperonospora brassicae]